MSASTAKTKTPKTPKAKKTLEELYDELVAAGPAEFLKEKGTDGKRLLRYAFDGTYQPFGPFDASAPAQLDSVIQALIDYAMAAYSAKFKEDDPCLLLVQTAKDTAVSLHTHYGKYLHAKSRSSFFSVAGEDRTVYLTSASAKGMRSVTAGFPHAPKQSAPAKLFLSTVQIDGAIVSIAELIASDNETVKAVFARNGVNESYFNRLGEIFKKVQANNSFIIDSFLPQLLWPASAGDLALTAIPGIPTYNAIAAMRGIPRETTYLRTSAFEVGSGQAQNISTAASSLAGHLPMLISRPPQVVASAPRRLIQRLHQNNLLLRVALSEKNKFFVDLSPLPNGPRKKFLEYAARRHVLAVMEQALELRDAIEQDAELAEELPASGLLRTWLCQEPLTEDLQLALFELVAKHFSFDADKIGVHSSLDWTHYYNCVKSTLGEL